MDWHDIVFRIMMNEKETITLPACALGALSLLEKAGYEAWCVGGFVRDSIMGRPVSDIDIATSALWQEVQTVFESAGLRTHETGISHGTITVMVEGEPIEITTYRNDGEYSDCRRPDEVSFVKTIEEDLARRDFTINAIAYHPERGFCDPYGGRSDIAAQIIRAVGKPQMRFGEDALRILRAVRFSAQLGFSIEEVTFEAMRTQKTLLARIAKERVFHELDAFVCGKAVEAALIESIEVIEEVIPELSPLKGFDQKTPYHIYDVLKHTAVCMQNTPPVPLVRWAALFHDIGKPASFSVDEAGVGHFYGHAKVSTKIAKEIMSRLRFPLALKAEIATLVTYHDYVFASTPKAVKRMLQKLGGRVDLLEALLDLKRGDCAAQAPQFLERVELTKEIGETLASILEAQEAFALHNLAIKGSDVIALGIEAGPHVGVLLQAALDAVIDEKVANEKPAILVYLQEEELPRKTALS